MSVLPRRNLDLLWLWVRREWRVRYAGSVLGRLWSALSPLLTIALYYVVFSSILRVRIPEIAVPGGFLYYLLSALVPWLFFTEAVSRAAGSVLAQERFLSRNPFPPEILPWAAVLASTPTLLVALSLVLALVAVVFSPSWWWLLLPGLMVLHVAWAGTIGAVLSVVALHLRDTLQVLPNLLQFLFFASPVIYSRSILPPKYQWLVLLNPVSSMAEAYHFLILGFPARWDWVLGLAGWSVVILGGGAWFYLRLRATIADRY